MDPKNGRPRWLKVWITSTLGETATLSPVAMGAYIRISLEQARRGEALPDDPTLLRKLTGVTRQWLRVREELAGVLVMRAGMISNPEVERFLADFHARSQRNRSNVGRRWRVVQGGAGIEDADE